MFVIRGDSATPADHCGIRSKVIRLCVSSVNCDLISRIPGCFTNENEAKQEFSFFSIWAFSKILGPNPVKKIVINHQCNLMLSTRCLRSLPPSVCSLKTLREIIHQSPHPNPHPKSSESLGKPLVWLKIFRSWNQSTRIVSWPRGWLLKLCPAVSTSLSS